MNILFLSLGKYNTIYTAGIYTDLLRTMVEHGHAVWVLSPIEKRDTEKEGVIREKGCTIIRVNTGNIQKTNPIEKGINTLLIETRFICAIKKYLSDVTFDLIVYPTPPVTFYRAVKYVKKKCGCPTYLMLKDIFPQNAVDLGMMPQSGVRGILYKIFRNKERRLYAVSDAIGCMSQANVEYVLKHNPEICAEKVEVCPNSVEIRDMSVSADEKAAMRKKYGIPPDKTVFVYGGNLGKPQGIPFVVECLRAEQNNEKAFFLIVGDGTEYDKLDAFVRNEKPANVKLMQRLPKEDYDRLVAACDVGMIFLDHRFSIPNFPSRLLSYMQAGLPVLACTDPNTDIGAVITEGNFGWWCESDQTQAFSECVAQALTSERGAMQKNAQTYLHDHYSVKTAYETLINALER